MSKLFEDVSTSDTVVPKVQCKFYQSSVVKNGSRLKTHGEKYIFCPKLVKDKYLAKLHVSTTRTTGNDSDEASEIENWLFHFSTNSAKSISKKPKQLDARSTLIHFADKMSTSEQKKTKCIAGACYVC